MRFETRVGWAGWVLGISVAVVSAAVLPSCNGDGGSSGRSSTTGGGTQSCPIKSDACATCQASLCADDCSDEACKADWAVAMDCICSEQVPGGDVVTCIGTFEGKQPSSGIDYCVQAGCSDECGF